MEVDEDGDVESQDWLVEKTHGALKEKDLFKAKCWLITAKSLFPLNFKVQVIIVPFQHQVATYDYTYYNGLKLFALVELCRLIFTCIVLQFLYFSMKLIQLKTTLKGLKKQPNFFLTCKWSYSYFHKIVYGLRKSRKANGICPKFFFSSYQTE